MNSLVLVESAWCYLHERLVKGTARFAMPGEPHSEGRCDESGAVYCTLAEKVWWKNKKQKGVAVQCAPGDPHGSPGYATPKEYVVSPVYSERVFAWGVVDDPTPSTPTASIEEVQKALDRLDLGGSGFWTEVALPWEGSSPNWEWDRALRADTHCGRRWYHIQAFYRDRAKRLPKGWEAIMSAKHNRLEIRLPEK